MLEKIWLIPLLPLVGVVLVGGLGLLTNCVAHRKLNKRLSHTIAIGVILIAFLLSVVAVYELTQLPSPRVHEVNLFRWIPGGILPTAGGLADFQVDWGYQLDPLSAVMILVVTGVGLLIHIYSIGYMWEDTGYYRYFAYMNLFMCAMLTLVLANSFLLMFVGWEGVGLCSYLLIGFYFDRKSAGDAGKKAFIVNRVGDAGFIIGMMLIFVTFGSLDFTEVFASVSRLPAETGFGILSAITLFLFIGAMGKSAQIPLYVWLPDAMEGPTPVSALIHAATMVTAGVYMVTRCNALYGRAPDTMMIVAITGVATAFFAATIGLVQKDIKRVLAYSTVSQLGYMFTACGVGAFTAGIFHLMTHAFFKALLFLGSGSVILAMHHEQDMTKMGGLKKYLPWTCRTMWVGTAAIAGIPLLSGFFSKDEILWKAYKSGHTMIWLVAWLAAGLTAFYMFRLMFLTFHGRERMDEHTAQHVHESPKSMVVPLVILAILAFLGGYIGLPAFMGHALHVENLFEEFLEPVMQLPAQEAGGDAGVSEEIFMTALSVIIAGLGIYVAFLFYIKNTGWPAKLAGSWPKMYQLLYRKYKVDELYDALFVNRSKDLGTALGSFDRTFVDGAVNGTASATKISATISRLFDTYVVDGLVNLVGITSRYLASLNRLIQTGVIQSYVMAIVLGVLFIVSCYLILGTG